MPTSSSSRPYLLRAIYEWLLDNNLTPHIVVAVDMPGVEVPSSHVEDGQLVLNISPDASRNLLLGNQELTFNARFGGASREVRIPIDAVMAVYARENSLGMVFGQEPRLSVEGFESVEVPEAEPKPAPDTKLPNQPTSKKASHLTVVK